MNLPRWFLVVIGHHRPLTGEDIVLREAAWESLARSRSRSGQSVADAWESDVYDSMSGCSHLMALQSRARAAVRDADSPAGYRWVLDDRSMSLVPTAAQCRRFIGKTVKGEIRGPLDERGYTMRWQVEVK